MINRMIVRSILILSQFVIPLFLFLSFFLVRILMIFRTLHITISSSISLTVVFTLRTHHITFRIPSSLSSLSTPPIPSIDSVILCVILRSYCYFCFVIYLHCTHVHTTHRLRTRARARFIALPTCICCYTPFLCPLPPLPLLPCYLYHCFDYLLPYYLTLLPSHTFTLHFTTHTFFPRLYLPFALPLPSLFTPPPLNDGPGSSVSWSGSVGWTMACHHQWRTAWRQQ